MRLIVSLLDISGFVAFVKVYSSYAKVDMTVGWSVPMGTCF